MLTVAWSLKRTRREEPKSRMLCADILGGQCLYVAKFLGLLTEETHPKSLAYLERLTKRPAFGKVFNPA